MIKEDAKHAIETELEEIAKLTDRIDDSFENAVKEMLHCQGKIIVTGMGKSGHIGKKIAASFSSTGTSSFFMHPAEAFHGDLGMVTDQDIVLAISNSGETAEIIHILPVIRRIGARIIAMTGNMESTLAKYSDYVLNIGVEKEADFLGLAPTSSTTTTLVMGDAVAVALLRARKFTSKDFALYHPGGSLGRKLLLKVSDVMHKDNENPVINYQKTIQDCLFIMTEKRLGAVSVIDDDGVFLGLITDGDIRRKLEKDGNFLFASTKSVMTKNPTVIMKDKLAEEALHQMMKNPMKPISVLPVMDESHRPIGMVHITDLLKYGIL